MGRHRVAITLATLAGGAFLFMQAAPARSETTVGFWAGERIPGTDQAKPGTYWWPRDTSAYTPALWSVLRRNHIPLYFNLRFRRDFGPVPKGVPHRTDALDIIREANANHVPVWGWVLIPYTAGYWASEGGVGEQFEAVKALIRWKKARKIRLRGIALDPEPPVGLGAAPTAAVMAGGSEAAASLFEPTIDPAAQCFAWRGYSEVLAWAGLHKMPIVAAPAPAALEDYEDGNLALQDAGQFVVPPGPWYQLYFQAYRSTFAYYGGSDPGSGIVSSYLLAARRIFGDVGQISLGSAGRAGYHKLSNLIHDVRLAATLGADKLPIYSLERALRSYGGPAAIERLAEAAHRPFTGSKKAAVIKETPPAAAIHARMHRADEAAVSATANITAARGNPQSPNPWPATCTA